MIGADYGDTPPRRPLVAPEIRSELHAGRPVRLAGARSNLAIALGQDHAKLRPPKLNHYYSASGFVA